MAGNTFGTLFRVTTWGESHGSAVGVLIDGCPPRLPLTERTVQEMLDRRRPGSAPSSTARREADRARILSGLHEGLTTGTPILILVENRDTDSNAYQPVADAFRPGHGDFTYQAKYGIRDWRGGGRASARETVGRVAAGAVAKALLAREGISLLCYTLELGGVRASRIDLDEVARNPLLCPDAEAAALMTRRVAAARSSGDSVGGIVEILARGVPAGLGEPVFDKLDADLAKALMSIGAVKGVEVGAGFRSAAMQGSTHNDPITPGGFASNNAGGILAGISNGEEILLRAAVKPIPSIAAAQQTVDTSGRPRSISITGRHDVAAIPRINVVCEAMAALALTDHLLRHRALGSDRSFSALDKIKRSK